MVDSGKGVLKVRGGDPEEFVRDIEPEADEGAGTSIAGVAVGPAACDGSVRGADNAGAKVASSKSC